VLLLIDGRVRPETVIHCYGSDLHNAAVRTAAQPKASQPGRPHRDGARRGHPLAPEVADSAIG
jgi:hypothetical protein